MGLALSVPTVSGTTAAGPEHRMSVADISGWRQPHAADQAGCKVRRDIVRQIFCHHDIEHARLAHEVELMAIPILIYSTHSHVLVAQICGAAHRLALTQCI